MRALSPEEARIVRALKQGDFLVTHHAEIRLRERNISFDDVVNVGFTAHLMVEQERHLFKIVGLDLEREMLTVIAAYDGNVLIVTLF